MPISPTVNSMQQNMQQPQEFNSAEQIFKSKFSDAAFATLRAKYPQLASIVITLRIIDSDVEQGTCLGAFIIQSGSDVKYVPVIMSAGSITSCEMVYNKADNSLLPLLPKIVQDLVNINKVETASLVSKAPRVEDTKGLFRDLTKPPHSSNAILASNGAENAVASLPNEAKKQVVNYLEGSPELLAKIAEYYPIEVLASKLAKVAEGPLPKVDYPDVVSIDALKHETIESLTSEEKEKLLRDGFAVKKDSDNTGLAVVPALGFKDEVTKEFAITEVPFNDVGANVAYTGHLFALDRDRVKLEHSLILSSTSAILGSSVGVVNTTYGHESKHYSCKSVNSIPVSNAKPATHLDIEAFGGVLAADLQLKVNSSYYFFVPTKIGTYKIIRKYFGNFTELDKTDGMVTLRNSFGESCTFSDAIQYGALEVTKSSLVLPYNTYVIAPEVKASFPVLRSIEKIVKYLQLNGKNIKLIDDGTHTFVSDKAKGTTKAMEKKAEVAKYLIDTHGFGRDEVYKTLEHKNIYVFDKTAFLNPRAQMDQGYSQEQAVSPVMQPNPGFNPQYIDDFAELGDQDLLDTGILASFANDADIKENFVDLLPSFSEALTSVGKTILICSINKKEMEDFYGREKYQTFVSNCKRVFKTLGEIVVGLKEYINMNE